MIPILKAEARKLLTVRSTYAFVGSALLLVMFFAGFTEGVRGTAEALAHNTGLLMSESSSAIVFTGLLAAFAGLLLVGHEYRYNTIMYTLSSSNRRFKVLLAKFLVVSLFAVLVSLVITLFSPLCTILGAHLAGKPIGPQHFEWWSIIWRCVFCGWGYAAYAFVLVAIMRNQIGAIVTFLMFPLVGEGLLGLLLKDDKMYLPFNAVQAVAVPSSLGNHNLSATHCALTVLVYVAVGLLVSMVLFVRRDAN